MIEFCSCLQCGNNDDMEKSSTIVLKNDSIINVNINSKAQQNTMKMVGYSTTRCLSSLISVRTARSFKSLCFLTAILTFCVGIGVGVLIPLYLMPKAESLLVGRSNTAYDYNYTSSNNVHDLYSSSSVLKRRAEASVMNQASTIPPPSSSSAFQTDESTDQDISNRFPEFAQIQALVQRSSTGDHFRTKVTSNSNFPILQRPNPNVQFITSDSRILSLHPVQQQMQNGKLNSTSSVTEPPISDSINTNDKVKLSADDENNNADLVEGIYWSKNVEKQLPKGFTIGNVTSWRVLVEHAAVEKIEEGCGRMQNRLLTLGNEIHACCRYRQNSDQIQGEIFSFYLSRLLGLENLAPSTLALIQLADTKWMKVRQELNAAQWTEEKPVVFTQFIKNLSPAYIPQQFRDSKRSLHPIDIILASNSIDSSLDVKELAQWSDLIVFDYLTANLDRMVNNLYNLQWNPTMMEAPAHNLVKDASTGLLVFLDNESGLLHGYRLLDKYEHYHRVMLDSLCIFRRSTVNAITKLHRDKNVGHLLKNMFHSSEPRLVDFLPMMPDKSIKILNHRIERVYNQIMKCESLYPL